MREWRQEGKGEEKRCERGKEEMNDDWGGGGGGGGEEEEEEEGGREKIGVKIIGELGGE